MPTYANLPRYQEPTPEAKSDRILQNVAGAVGGYQKLKATEHAQAVIANPKATPIEKAMALASIGQEKLGTEVFKKAADQSALSGIEQRLNQNLGRGQPNVPGATPPIRPNEPIATQPGATEAGTATQPGFTPNAPQAAARNATALQPNAQPPIMAGAPQAAPQPQVDPEQEAQAYEQAAMEAAKENRHDVATQYANKANQIRKDIRNDKQAKQKQENVDRTERLDIHNSLEKPYNKIHDEAEHAESHLRATGQAREAIASGKVGTKGIPGIARTFFKGSKWEDYWKNPDQALLEAAALEDFVGMKEMFGVRLSDADLRVASGKVISPYKSNEANLAIIDYREFQDKMKISKAKVADQIVEENGGFRPIDMQAQIRQRMAQLYGQEADRILENAVFEGQPVPKPSPQDPLMESMYGKVPEGQTRLKKGTQVITIPYAYLQDALNDDFMPLEKGAE